MYNECVGRYYSPGTERRPIGICHQRHDRPNGNFLIRSIAERELGRHFTSEEFLYELLRQGKLPQGYLEEHIRDYIACKKDPTIEGCKEF